MPGFLIYLVVVLLVAALLRVDFFFYLLYLTIGVVVLGRAWARRSAARVSFSRAFPERVFWGEKPAVQIEVRNGDVLPVLWLQLHDSLPFELRSPNFFQQVVSLRPHERQRFTYELDCRKRGYFTLGPLALQSGDLLGTLQVERHEQAGDRLIVYPRIVPLPDLNLPSRTLFGSLPSKQQIFEDPTRMSGVRDYVPGDSLRRIAWKTSATLGRLQVKRFQPAIALDTMIFVDLSRKSYSTIHAWAAPELGIVVAASIGNWLVERRQAVGLASNGRDPLANGGAGAPASAIRPRKGRQALMQTLDLLARVEVCDEADFYALLRREAAHLAWGSTLVLVTGVVREPMYDALSYLRHNGFSVVLVCVDPSQTFRTVRQRAARLGVPSFAVWDEASLERWGLNGREEA